MSEVVFVGRRKREEKQQLQAKQRSIREFFNPALLHDVPEASDASIDVSLSKSSPSLTDCHFSQSLKVTSLPVYVRGCHMQSFPLNMVSENCLGSSPEVESRLRKNEAKHQGLIARDLSLEFKENRQEVRYE